MGLGERLVGQVSVLVVAVQHLARVEAVLGLWVKTLKICIMGNERCTTVNLKECICAAKARVA
jgi:malate synthase